MREHLHQRQEQMQVATWMRLLIAWRPALAILVVLVVLGGPGHQQRTTHDDSYTALSGDMLRSQYWFVFCKLEYRDLTEAALKQAAQQYAAITRVNPNEKRPDFSCARAEKVRWTTDRDVGQLDLSGALFRSAVLPASQFGASSSLALPVKLVEATFIGAYLRDANFENVSLQGANFQGADLRGVNFMGADLTGADFADAAVDDAIFEPRSGAASFSLRRADGLERLRFFNDPDALLELRDSFKKGGRRDLERRLTFAIEKSRTENLWRDGDSLAALVRTIAWEIPTKYDLAPTRALALLASSIVLFAGIYLFALIRWAPPMIWRVLPADRLNGDGKQVFEPVRATPWESPRYALMFSLLSAFHIGWRDLNVGTWLTRLQSTEYSMRASGWVRTVSGVQSLLSVYLLAMWALTQFGRLFEG